MVLQHLTMDLNMNTDPKVTQKKDAKVTLNNTPKNTIDQALESSLRRPCGCLKTSDKLRQLLEKFPSPPPPSSQNVPMAGSGFENTCISAFCMNDHELFKAGCKGGELIEKYADVCNPPKKTITAQSWWIVLEIGQILQLSVTATALALYYIIYCYMQLIYFALRSAVFFHNADGPMRITIAVVSVTSFIVGFNLLLRMERMIGI